MSSFSDDDYRLFQIHMRSIRSQDCIVFLGPGRRSALADSLLEAFGVNVNEVGRFVTAPDPSVYEAACGRRSDMADRLFKACEINMKKDRRFVTATDPSVYEAACGKSSLTDSSFAPPEIEVQEAAKDVQITDTRVDEAGRGKSSLTDSFFAPPEIEVQEVAKDVQITDTRVDEAGRGITIKSTVETQINQPAKLWWGELEEDNGEDLTFLLPPRKVIRPDENGIKKVIEYEFDDDGNTVRAVERRACSEFGDAVKGDAVSRLTMVSTEDILLERPKPIGSNNVDQPVDPLGAAGAVLMVCRSCGKKGDHWTSRCPNKDLSKPTEGFIDKPPIAVSNNGAYVPPSLRGGAKRTGGSDMRWRNDENSVRVTNLSEDTREPDLHELFCPFGSVKRVYVDMDKNTGVSQGFGFVNFVSREDAQRAINKLNGYGYDNLILKVEWATPRTT